MSVRPPVFATWLLTYLGCSPNNEAVIGDLQERYRLRPQRFWYWRQALRAIVKSFLNEILGHKLDAACALVVGWAALISVWLLSAPLVMNTDVRTHHACTFFWFIAGIVSSIAVRLWSRRPHRPMILLYVASLWFFLLIIHSKPSAANAFVYWADTFVLSVSVVLGALPLQSRDRVTARVC